MITLAVTVQGTTRVYPVTTTMTRVNRGGGWDDWNEDLGPWLSAEDSTDCNNFAGMDAEHINQLFHEGSMTSCDFAGDKYELRIDGVHDHDAIIKFYDEAFDEFFDES